MNGIEKYEKEHSVTIFYRLHLDETEKWNHFFFANSYE